MTPFYNTGVGIQWLEGYAAVANIEAAAVRARGIRPR